MYLQAKSRQLSRIIYRKGRVAALVMLHMNGSIPFEKTIDQASNRNNVSRAMTAASKQKNYKLTRAATLGCRKMDILLRKI